MTATYTKGATGRGITLSGEFSGSTYTAIAQLKSNPFSGQKWNYDDVTNAGSPPAPATGTALGVQEESLPVTYAPGEVQLEGVFIGSDAGWQDLLAAHFSGALIPFKIQLPVLSQFSQTTTGDLWSFSAYVSDMPAPDFDYKKIMTFKCTLKLNTIPVYTEGS